VGTGTPSGTAGGFGAGRSPIGGFGGSGSAGKSGRPVNCGGATGVPNTGLKFGLGIVGTIAPAGGNIGRVGFNIGKLGCVYGTNPPLGCGIRLPAASPGNTGPPPGNMGV